MLMNSCKFKINNITDIFPDLNIALEDFIFELSFKYGGTLDINNVALVK